MVVQGGGRNGGGKDEEEFVGGVRIMGGRGGTVVVVGVKRLEEVGGVMGMGNDEEVYKCFIGW